MQQSIGADTRFHIIGYRPWAAGQALAAERYKAGRIMISGDAAHVFTPTGGFGMNTGIDDSAKPGVEACGRAARLGRPKAARQLPCGTQTDRPSQHRGIAEVCLDDARRQRAGGCRGRRFGGDAARIAAANLSYVRKNHFVRPEDQDAVGVQIGGALRRLAGHRCRWRASGRHLPGHLRRIHAKWPAWRAGAAPLARCGARPGQLPVRPLRQGLHVAPLRPHGRQAPMRWHKPQPSGTFRLPFSTLLCRKAASFTVAISR